MTWDNVITQANVATAEAIAEPPMDEEAFTAFYERTARQVWAYLARVSGNATLADDLLQESYVRFLGAAAPWQHGEVACRNYLFRIATNLLRDHWRRWRMFPKWHSRRSAAAIPSASIHTRFLLRRCSR